MKKTIIILMSIILLALIFIPQTSSDFFTGTEEVFASVDTAYENICPLNSTYFVVTYRQQSNSLGYSRIGKNEPNGAITWKTTAVNTIGRAHGIVKSCSLNSTDFILFYQTTFGSDTYRPWAVWCRFTGTTITVIDDERILSTSGYPGLGCERLNSTDFLTHYQASGSSNAGYVKVMRATGTTITVLSTTALTPAGNHYGESIVAVNSTHFFHTYNWGVQTVSLWKVSSGGTVVTQVGASITTPSGAYTSDIRKLNQTYFLLPFTDSAGTTNKVIIGKYSGGLISFTTGEVTFTTSTISNTHISATTFNNTHFAICYQNISNSNYGTIVIGQYIGGSISFLNKNVFNSGTTTFIDIENITKQRSYVVYRDESNGGYGTICYNSFGTPIVTTNDATGISTTNATLQGILTKSYDTNSWCRFQYGLTTSYGTTTANQTKTTGQTFSFDNLKYINESNIHSMLGQNLLFGAYMKAMTFTIGTNGSNISGFVDRVSLHIQRSGVAGTLYIMIRNTNSTGQPLTTNISSTAIPYTSISTSTGLKTFTIQKTELRQGIKYALCLYSPDSDVVKNYALSTDGWNFYTGGSPKISSDRGQTWSNYGVTDYIFSIYNSMTQLLNIFDKQTTDKTSDKSIFSATIYGQTFSQSTAHTFNTIELYGYEIGTPGTVTIDFYATTGGVPTGASISHGSTSATTLSTTPSTFTIGFTAFTTTPSTTYAFVIRANQATGADYLTVNISSSNVYSNGTAVSSTNNGTSYIIRTAYDFYFKLGSNLLLPGTLYHYRAIANNTNGTSYGADKTFTTATTPTGSFNATRIFAHYCDLNATIIDDGQGTPYPYITGCNARIQIVNATTYPDWTKAKNTTWSGYKTDGKKAYWNHTLLPANVFANDRPGMKYYYQLQLNNTYYRNNYTAKTFISQPEDLTAVHASPDYDDPTSRIKIWWSGGGNEYYNKTVIRYSTIGYPATPSDGTLLFNGTEWDEWMLNWTAPTQYNSMIYLSVWRWSTWGGLSTYSNVSRAVVKTPLQYQTRAFVTNQILVTSTTMRIACIVKSGGLPCWLRAEYGLTTAYGTNTAYQTGVTNGTYYFDLTGLTPGKLYYVRAKINNTATTNYSNSKIPIPYYVNTNTIDPDIYWTGGYLPNYVFLYNRTIADRCMNTIFQPYAGNINIIWAYNYTAGTWKSWTPGEGCTFKTVNELRPLWMRLASNFTQTIKLSDWGFLTRPAPPTHAQYDIFNNTAVNLSWTKGTGSNRSVVVMSNTHLPTSTTDGTTVYNGTGNYTHLTITAGLPYYCTVYGWTTWTYNPTLSFYSANSTMLNWSFIGVNCFNESNPSQAITPFNVQFKDNTGLHTYTAMGVSNTFILNLTDIPVGTNILIEVWATGYQDRLMYQTITNSTFYNLSFYLPPLETNGTGGGGTGDCTIRTHTNSINVSNPFVDATIPFTHHLEDMIQVERYNGSADNLLRTAYNSINVTDPTNDVTINLTHTLDDMVSVEVYNTSIDRTLRTYTNTKSITSMTQNVWVSLTHTPESFISIQVWNTTLYGTYGGWYTVPADKYTYVSANNTVNISKTILNTHVLTITIASINYYYWGAGTYGTWQYISTSKYTFNNTAIIVNETALDSYSSMLRVVYYWVQPGSQGIWQFIPETWYSYNTTRVIINTSGMDDYTTMLRVTYYWQDCPGNPVATPLYYCRVVETIETEYSTYDRAVENADVWFQTYISTLGHYVNVSTLITDGNGYVSVYLIPGNLYQVVITKTGYDLYRANYQPPPPNSLGQTVEKIFRIVLAEPAQPGGVDYEYLMRNITWDFSPKGLSIEGAFTFYFNITSTDNMLEWFSLTVSKYNYSSYQWENISYQKSYNAGGGSLHYNVSNITGKYSFQLWIKKTGYAPYELTQGGGGIEKFLIYLEDWMKQVPDFAYYIVVLVIMLIVAGFCHLYLGTGILTGYIALGIMAMALAIHEFSVPLTSSFSISGWMIFAITFIMYSAGLFLWSKI